jgi:hypothetical protein
MGWRDQEKRTEDGCVVQVSSDNLDAFQILFGAGFVEYWTGTPQPQQSLGHQLG